ncbi:MAG: hypothetical protein ACI81R_002336 [Bradymonadia bacterium]
MRLSYRDLHWGATPTGHVGLAYPSGDRATVDGELVAISYVATKGPNKRPQVFRHAFEPFEGRRAHLLRATPGSVRTPALASPPAIALGRVVDLELADGRVVCPIDYWIVTESVPAATNGGTVVLACTYGPELAIEHRSDTAGRQFPYITAHGIEG